MSDPHGITEEEMEEREREREDAQPDDQLQRGADALRAEYWGRADDAMIRRAWAEVDKGLDRRRAEVQAYKSIEDIDRDLTHGRNRISDMVAGNQERIARERERKEAELATAEGDDAKDRIKREIATLDRSDALLQDYRKYALETVEKFYGKYRSDLTAQVRKPLWRRQKFWSWVAASVFACSGATVAIATILYNSTKDSNAARHQAELDQLARENNVDVSTIQALEASISATKQSMVTNGYATYLPWLRDAIKNFHLGAASIRDLIYFFGLDAPTGDATGTPPSAPLLMQAQIDGLVAKLVASYATTQPASYGTLLQQLIVFGQTGTRSSTDGPDVPSVSAGTVQGWSAAQFNWILAGSLAVLLDRFAAGTSAPPG